MKKTKTKVYLSANILDGVVELTQEEYLNDVLHVATTNIIFQSSLQEDECMVKGIFLLDDTASLKILKEIKDYYGIEYLRTFDDFYIF